MNTAQRKITMALKEAAAYHRSGDDPNESIVKAAHSNQLNPDMVHRVVEAFNIAKTNTTLKKASDKTASFPLAEIEKVMEGVFKRPLHSKAARREREEDPVEAAISEFQEVRQPIELNWGGIDKLAATATDLREDVREGLGLIAEMDADLSKAAQSVQQYEMDAFKAMESVVDYFSLSESRGKFAEFEQQMLSEYGDGIKTTLDSIHALSSIKHARHEGAVPVSGITMFDRCGAHDFFDALMDKTARYHEAEENHEAMKMDHDGRKTALLRLMREADGQYVPEEGGAADLLKDAALGDWIKKKVNYEKGDKTPEGYEYKSELYAQLEHARRTGKTVTKAEWEAAGKPGLKKEGEAAQLLDFGSKKKTADLSLSAPAQSLVGSAQAGAAAGLADHYSKAHSKAIELLHKGPKDKVDMEIDNVRRQAILQDLMANDEIVGRMDPKHIEHHYNVLLQMSPDLTLNSSIVRSFLHSAGASQSVDPFTAHQLAQTQGQQTKNKMLREGNVPRPGL